MGPHLASMGETWCNWSLGENHGKSLELYNFTNKIPRSWFYLWTHQSTLWSPEPLKKGRISHDLTMKHGDIEIDIAWFNHYLYTYIYIYELG